MTIVRLRLLLLCFNKLLDKSSWLVKVCAYILHEGSRKIVCFLFLLVFELSTVKLRVIYFNCHCVKTYSDTIQEVCVHSVVFFFRNYG